MDYFGISHFVSFSVQIVKAVFPRKFSTPAVALSNNGCIFVDYILKHETLCLKISRYWSRSICEDAEGVWKCCQTHSLVFDRQGSYGSWKTWKVLEFDYGIFQDWKVLEKGYWSWKVLEICSTLVKNMKCMADSKENQHWDLGNERVNVNFRVLENSIWGLEKSWKSPVNLFLKKGANPVKHWCLYNKII